MKPLSDEEIAKLAFNAGHLYSPNAFAAGYRAAESRLLPFVEANDYLIIDTAEKRKACEPMSKCDEFWHDNKGTWERVSMQSSFTNRDIYRRPIRWHKVSETPTPDNMPVWLGFNDGHILLSQSGVTNPHCDATHWRYAQIPTPPQIDKEREAFEVWYAAQKCVIEPIHGAADHKECCWIIWQAARKEGK